MAFFRIILSFFSYYFNKPIQYINEIQLNKDKIIVMSVIIGFYRLFIMQYL